MPKKICWKHAYNAINSPVNCECKHTKTLNKHISLWYKDLRSFHLLHAFSFSTSSSMVFCLSFLLRSNDDLCIWLLAVDDNRYCAPWRSHWVNASKYLETKAAKWNKYEQRKNVKKGRILNQFFGCAQQKENSHIKHSSFEK